MKLPGITIALAFATLWLLSSHLTTLAAQSTERTVAFVGATVIDPAQEHTIVDGTVVVVDGKIQAVTSGGEAVPSDATVIDVTGKYLVPGLIDAHVHIADIAAARRALRSGVTTARDMGVPHFVDVGMRELAKLGAIEAPEIVASGYHVRPRPDDGLFMDDPNMADLLAVGVHGEEAMRRLARFMIDRDVQVIKVNATERAGLPETDPRKPFYSEAELRALVTEAGNAGIPVAAHAHGEVGGRAAVLAGVASIEHGTYLSDQTLALMADRGTYLVPTIAVVADLTMPGGDYDNAVLNVRGRHMLPRVRQMARHAHERGVTIAAATDTGYGPESVLRLSHELMELVDIGMTTLEAMQAATTVAAELLGVDDHTGELAQGFDADILILERNPLQDIGAYQDVLLVMNDGRIVVDRSGY
jgi:imidazolonepropionase-like amidohydrolase